MTKTYIARKYVAIEGCAKHFYEEGCFSSYEKALEFIKKISEEEDDVFLSEIVCYPLDSNNPCDLKEVFIFDRKGALIKSNNAKERNGDCYDSEETKYKTVYENLMQESFTGKYKLGDIVFIKAYPWNNVSPVCTDTIGIISNVPISLKKWISDNKSKFEWDNAYVVNYIRDGYLEHMHVVEDGIVNFDGIIPNNLCFLKILADHYLNIKTIPQKILNDILSGKIFVENVKTFFRE